MYLNNKGFAISTVLYSLLIMATLILFLLVGNLSFERRTTSNFVNDIKDELNAFASIFGNSKSEGKSLAEALLTNVGDKGSYYDDGTDTFITGEDPNNYIWYSGKLWRAVSINNAEKTIKMVTQWSMAIISYSSGGSNFQNSYLKQWLNDTSVDGFLGNLRNPESFLKMDSTWNLETFSGSLNNINKPNNENTDVSAVGLLNAYEYKESFTGTDYTNGYLNNKTYWWTLSPSRNSSVINIHDDGNIYFSNQDDLRGIRPVVNLKTDIEFVSGDGTVNNPYRLKDDNDTDLNGTLLNTRYSGEYIKIGEDNENLYRIISHENGSGTKVTSAEPLKRNGKFVYNDFGNNAIFSSTNKIGTFLNGEYLLDFIGEGYSNLIEENTTWYLGRVADGANYRLAKYIDNTSNTVTTYVTTAKVGLPRLGELMSGQTNNKNNNITFWMLTPCDSSTVYLAERPGHSIAFYATMTGTIGVKPTFNLKSNVIITSGDGTKQNPFTLSVQ